MPDCSNQGETAPNQRGTATARARASIPRQSYYADELEADPSLAVDVYIAKPRMSHYLNASGKIYGIYLRYASRTISPSTPSTEVFMDATRYLHATEKPRTNWHATSCGRSNETGITATAGIGTNLYLAKVALDIVAKHIPADAEGVRVATSRNVAPPAALGAQALTDFWRVGRGCAKKLESHGLMTMGDIARCSLGRASDYYNEELLYRLFGVNAQAAHRPCVGMGACTIADIKAYKPPNTVWGGRAGADQCDPVRHRPADREGNGGNTGIGLGEQGG